MKNYADLIDVPRNFAEAEPEREARIRDEIIVDAYGDEEVTSSWYYHLQEALNFPFSARVQPPPGRGRQALPVRVVGMAPMSRCGYWQMWVLGGLAGRQGVLLHIFLSDVTGVEADPERVQALTDWNYWRRRQTDELLVYQAK